MIDTAGIRDTEDIVEKIGVEKSLKKLEEVDLVIYMFSALDEIDEKDLKLLSRIENKGLKYIVLINKMDKVEKSIFDTFMKQLEQNNIKNVIPVSVINDDGIEKLKNKIQEIFNKNDLDYEHELIVTNARHKDLLKKSVEFLNQALQEIKNNNPIDIVSIYIKDASKYLGEIIGADVSVDVVNKIFEKFCLGK